MKVRLWKDIWCGEEPLSLTFPTLFSLALVADFWDLVGEEGGWSPHFVRSFNDWELEEV